MPRTIQPIKARIVKTNKQLIQEAKKAIFAGRFANLNKSDSNKIRAIILDGLKRGQTLATIKYRIELIIGEDSAPQAQLITRTEVQAVRTVLRVAQFEMTDPNNKNLYEWLGPSDRRTTKWCIRIEARTKKGVKLEKLKKIIKEEAMPNFYDPNRPFSPHYNCRHTVVRFFK